MWSVRPRNLDDHVPKDFHVVLERLDIEILVPTMYAARKIPFRPCRPEPVAGYARVAQLRGVGCPCRHRREDRNSRI